VPAHRFPLPWSAEETDACFIVRDANGQALGYFYFEDEPGRHSAAKLLRRQSLAQVKADAPPPSWTRDEADASPPNIAKAAGAAAPVFFSVLDCAGSASS
jgi:hypothetical protein